MLWVFDNRVVRSILAFGPTRKEGNRWEKKNCMLGKGMVCTLH